MLASPSRFAAEAAQAGLDIARTHAFGRDYAETLAPLARRVRCQRRRGARAGLRRAIHPLLAVLSRLLHRGLRERIDRCRAIHARRALTARGRWPARSPQLSPWLRAPATCNVAAPPLPAAVAAIAPGVRPQGGGEMTFFGLSIYDGWYWSGAHAWLPKSSTRSISTTTAVSMGPASRSAASPRSKGSAPATPRSANAGARRCAASFPNVRKGDRITGVNLPPGIARFFFNGQPIGEIDDPRVHARVLRHLARSAHVAPRVSQAAAGRAGIDDATRGNAATAAAPAALASPQRLNSRQAGPERKPRCR